jgi:N-acetylmuramoyl-L-alanine amidase
MVPSPLPNLMLSKPLVKAVALLGAGLWFAPGAWPAAPLKVTDVRFWSLGDVTRVAIQTNGEFRYRYERLPHPDRVFFDLLGAKPPAGSGKIHVIPVGDRMLKQIRVAEAQPGVTRVVLDLEPDVQYAASQLSSPDRLMVELRPTGEKASPSTARSVTGGNKLADPSPEAVAKGAATVELVVEPEGKPTPPEATPPASDQNLQDAIALPAKRNRTGGRSLTRVLGLKLGRVVIDAGHGGHDSGTIGPGGLMEKELVLDVALRLGKLIEEGMGSEVIHTRATDAFISLEARTQLANDRKADLFLSIHANASPYRSVTGSETYYLNFTTSRTALEVAARENAGSQRSMHELQELVQKITLKDKLEESSEFATRMQAAVSPGVSGGASAAKNRGVKTAPFVVLIGASMPSVLVEIGFLSNPKEESLLKRPDQRQRTAEALYRGLSQYASTLSRFQVAQRTAP